MRFIAGMRRRRLFSRSVALSMATMVPLILGIGAVGYGTQVSE